MKDAEQEKLQEENRKLENRLQREIAQKEKALAAQEKKIQAERRKLQNQAIKETIKANQQLREENRRHTQLLKEIKKAEQQKQAQKKGSSSRRKGQTNTAQNTNPPPSETPGITPLEQLQSRKHVYFVDFTTPEKRSTPSKARSRPSLIVESEQEIIASYSGTRPRRQNRRAPKHLDGYEIGSP